MMMIGGLRAGDEKRDRLLHRLLMLARCLSNFVERVFSRAGDHLAVLLSQDGGTLTLLVAGGLGLVPGCKELERELIAWQVEPRVMEERGGSFNFLWKMFE